MFQKTSCDGASQITLGMLSPPVRELPNGLRLCLDELADANDRLPSRVTFPLGRRRTGKYAFRAGDRSLDGAFGRHNVMPLSGRGGARAILDRE
ncbi:MAG: hypothetical protein QOF78_4023 [Phycisphaerales bacterium]|nr:hypothetical protein [Phycisphaerales bacterium]